MTSMRSSQDLDRGDSTWQGRVLVDLMHEGNILAGYSVEPVWMDSQSTRASIKTYQLCQTGLRLMIDCMNPLIHSLLPFLHHLLVRTLLEPVEDLQRHIVSNSTIFTCRQLQETKEQIHIHHLPQRKEGTTSRRLQWQLGCRRVCESCSAENGRS